MSAAEIEAAREAERREIVAWLRHLQTRHYEGSGDWIAEARWHARTHADAIERGEAAKFAAAFRPTPQSA